MWFIYYLIWFCLLAAAVASIVPRIPAGFLRAVDACFVLLAMRWWGLVFFSVPLAIIGSGYRAGIVAPTGSFIPTLNERAQHGLFFAFGICCTAMRKRFSRSS